MAELEDVVLLHSGVHPAFLQTWPTCSTPREAILLPEARLARMEDLLLTFLCYIPKARAPAPTLVCSRPDPSSVVAAAAASRALAQVYFLGGGYDLGGV